jgi:hypothetical protein
MGIEDYAGYFILFALLGATWIHIAPGVGSND